MEMILLDVAVKSTVVLAGAFGAAWGMRRSSAAARHWVWVLAFAALLVLPVLAAVLPAWHVLPSWSHQSNVVVVENAPSEVQPSQRPPLRAARAEVHALTESISPNASARSTTASTVAALASSSTFSLPSILSIYILGIAIFLLPVFAGALALVRLERKSVRLNQPPWPALLANLSARLGFCRPIALLESPSNTTMPMTWGVRRSRILLPITAQNWSADRRRLVLLHELAHAKRCDAVAQLLARLVCAMYWFHPLAWLALRQLRIEAEIACDDLVLAADTKPSAYAAELLDIVSSQRRLSFSMPAVAMARVNPPQLHSRIRAILNHARNRKTLPVTVILGMAVMATFILLPLAALHAQISPAAATSAPSRRFNNVSLFINNTRYGSDNGCTGSLDVTGVMTCGHPDAVSEVSWAFLGATPQGDRYEFTRKFSSDAKDPAAIKTTTKTVTYRGESLIVFEDAVQKISISEFPHRVHIDLGNTQFLPGDNISITEIRGTAGAVTPGNTYQIKGTYTLASAEEANLATYVTGSANDTHHDPYDPRQAVAIKKGSGTFTVVLPFISKGSPHLSFYPTHGGQSFSALYFGSGESLWKTGASVLILVSPTGISFEGEATTWEALPALLEKVPNRQGTILAFALMSDQMTVAAYHEAFAHVAELGTKFHFRYVSDTGIKAEGMPAVTQPAAAFDPYGKTIIVVHNGKVQMQFQDGKILFEADKLIRDGNTISAQGGGVVVTKPGAIYATAPTTAPRAP